MQDFDSLKNIWKQTPGQESTSPEMQISKASSNVKMKMQKQQLGGSIMLVLTAVLVGILAIFGDLNFTKWYTYVAMGLICVICISQAIFMFGIYRKLKRIDETATPAFHLQQWENYYETRKKQNRWNMPVYYLLLNVAMGIYLVEVFTGRPLVNVAIFISVYIAWMLFAYFYLGKKNMKKEDGRLSAIINELKSIETQLQHPE